MGIMPDIEAETLTPEQLEVRALIMMETPCKTHFNSTS